jgi:hypothetical protein
MTNTRRILAVAVAAAAFAATTAHAAEGAKPGYGRGECGDGPGRGQMSQMHGHFGGGNPAAMAAGHLAALKVELKITRDQEAAWEKFAGKATKQAEGMAAQREQMCGDRTAANLPAPERLAKHTEIAKQHIANMESMTAAVKELYAALTPEQKKTADDLLARGPMGGPGGPRGMGGMGGPGGMHHGFRS